MASPTHPPRSLASSFLQQTPPMYYQLTPNTLASCSGNMRGNWLIFPSAYIDEFGLNFTGNFVDNRIKKYFDVVARCVERASLRRTVIGSNKRTNH